MPFNMKFHAVKGSFASLVGMACLSTFQTLASGLKSPEDASSDPQQKDCFSQQEVPSSLYHLATLATPCLYRPCPLPYELCTEAEPPRLSHQGSSRSRIPPTRSRARFLIGSGLFLVTSVPRGLPWQISPDIPAFLIFIITMIIGILCFVIVIIGPMFLRYIGRICTATHIVPLLDTRTLQTLWAATSVGPSDFQDCDVKQGQQAACYRVSESNRDAPS